MTTLADEIRTLCHAADYRQQLQYDQKLRTATLKRHRRNMRELADCLVIRKQFGNILTADSLPPNELR